MKVHEILVEDAINVQQDSKKLLKSLGDVCREHNATMDLHQSRGASIGKTGSSWSCTFRMRKRGDASLMDNDEQELTLRLLRRDIIKWLKERMAEGRVIGTSRSPADATTNPDDLLEPIKIDSDGYPPQFTGNFFIGIPSDASTEHVVRIIGHGLMDLDMYKKRQWSKLPDHTYAMHNAIPFDIATSFTDETEAKRVVKQLNAALKSQHAHLLFKLALDAVKQFRYGNKSLGFNTLSSGILPVNTPAEVEAYIQHKIKNGGFRITVKKGIKAKDTIMVEKDKLLELMKKHGIS
jgi:hypothetical protein